MGNVDVEIYISQLIKFFETNQNDLMELIGDVQKDEFFDKVREQCQKNHDNGEDIALTRQQMVDIILDLKLGDINDDKPKIKTNVDRLFEKTTIGYICLN